jgi:hypothetical protein
MKVSIHVFMHVCGLQWSKSRTYTGCSGHNCVHTQVAVGIFTYVHELQWEQSRMHVGCIRDNCIHPYRVSRQEQVHTG